MSEKALTVTVRQVNPFVKVLDLKGSVSSLSERTLQEAYAQAVSDNFQTIILNFTEVDYINSVGIGMLVTLLVRAQRESRRMVAYGLNEHYLRIFELTRLNQVLPNYASEEIAIAFAAPHTLPEREN